LDEKARIRQDILGRRDSIEIGARKKKDLLIQEALLSLPEFHQAGVVFFFASFRSEVSTSSLIEEALRREKSVLLPSVDVHSRELRLFEIKSLLELSPGYMTISEPAVDPERKRDINDANLVILPGVAFDRSGNRLGYGGGYYDKLLARLNRKIPLIALSYKEQVVDSIPHDNHDIRVHIIVTDDGIIRCMG